MMCCIYYEYLCVMVVKYSSDYYFQWQIIFQFTNPISVYQNKVSFSYCSKVFHNLCMVYFFIIIIIKREKELIVFQINSFIEIVFALKPCVLDCIEVFQFYFSFPLFSIMKRKDKKAKIIIINRKSYFFLLIVFRIADDYHSESHNNAI